MHLPKNLPRKITLTVVTLTAMTAAVFGIEILLAIPGPDDHFHNPSRQPVHFGGPGKALVYVVMGDSTAAGRGAGSAEGIAVGTAGHLSRSHAVEMVNLGVSGAVIADVVRDQLPQAERLRPDVVLLAVGANDETHFTRAQSLRTDLAALLTGLTMANPRVRVVLTGSPDVGTVPRFAQPLRWLAGVRTRQVNAAMESVCHEHAMTWAPIALETGPLFARDRGLFAPDRFHPNGRGYATWMPVLDTALDEALRDEKGGRT
jgi:lysophospholipase L1-like esterase